MLREENAYSVTAENTYLISYIRRGKDQTTFNNNLYFSCRFPI